MKIRSFQHFFAKNGEAGIKIHLDASDSSLLSIANDRIDVPPENRLNSSTVFLLSWSAKIDDSSLDACIARHPVSSLERDIAKRTL